MMIKAMVLFLAAGFAEIGGGYLVWLWLRESKPLWVGVYPTNTSKTNAQ
jgi:small multidrug resistance family-3 protein